MHPAKLRIPKKITKIDLIKLNQQTISYFYPGYDIYFIHGWFTSYLSSSSDSEEDLILPTYLLLNEDKTIDEKKFALFVDELMYIYSEIADNIYEKNRQIKPLGSLVSPNDFSVLELDEPQKKDLLIWLYGYLCGYLVIGNDISEYCTNQNLLDNKFYPALYTICVVFLLLGNEINTNKLFKEIVLEDYEDVRADIIDMWEDEENRTILDEIKNISLSEALSDFINALNTVFYVVRVGDEEHFSESSPNSLLKKLVVH